MLGRIREAYNKTKTNKALEQEKNRNKYATLNAQNNDLNSILSKLKSFPIKESFVDKKQSAYDQDGNKLFYSINKKTPSGNNLQNLYKEDKLDAFSFLAASKNQKELANACTSVKDKVNIFLAGKNYNENNLKDIPFIKGSNISNFDQLRFAIIKEYENSNTSVNPLVKNIAREIKVEEKRIKEGKTLSLKDFATYSQYKRIMNEPLDRNKVLTAQEIKENEFELINNAVSFAKVKGDVAPDGEQLYDNVYDYSFVKPSRIGTLDISNLKGISADDQESFMSGMEGITKRIKRIFGYTVKKADDKNNFKLLEIKGKNLKINNKNNSKASDLQVAVLALYKINRDLVNDNIKEYNKTNIGNVKITVGEDKLVKYNTKKYFDVPKQFSKYENSIRDIIATLTTINSARMFFGSKNFKIIEKDLNLQVAQKMARLEIKNDQWVMPYISEKVFELSKENYERNKIRDTSSLLNLYKKNGTILKNESSLNTIEQIMYSTENVGYNEENIFEQTANSSMDEENFENEYSNNAANNDFKSNENKNNTAENNQINNKNKNTQEKYSEGSTQREPGMSKDYNFFKAEYERFMSINKKFKAGLFRLEKIRELPTYKIYYDYYSKMASQELSSDIKVSDEEINNKTNEINKNKIKLFEKLNKIDFDKLTKEQEEEIRKAMVSVNATYDEVKKYKEEHKQDNKKTNEETNEETKEKVEKGKTIPFVNMDNINKTQDTDNAKKMYNLLDVYEKLITVKNDNKKGVIFAKMILGKSGKIAGEEFVDQYPNLYNKLKEATKEYNTAFNGLKAFENNNKLSGRQQRRKDEFIGKQNEASNELFECVNEFINNIKEKKVQIEADRAKEEARENQLGLDDIMNKVNEIKGYDKKIAKFIDLVFGKNAEKARDQIAEKDRNFMANLTKAVGEYKTYGNEDESEIESKFDKLKSLIEIFGFIKKDETEEEDINKNNGFNNNADNFNQDNDASDSKKINGLMNLYNKILNVKDEKERGILFFKTILEESEKLEEDYKKQYPELYKKLKKTTKNYKLAIKALEAYPDVLGLNSKQQNRKDSFIRLKSLMENELGKYVNEFINNIKEKKAQIEADRAKEEARKNQLGLDDIINKVNDEKGYDKKVALFIDLLFGDNSEKAREQVTEKDIDFMTNITEAFRDYKVSENDDDSEIESKFDKLKRIIKASGFIVKDEVKEEDIIKDNNFKNKLANSNNSKDVEKINEKNKIKKANTPEEKKIQSKIKKQQVFIRKIILNKLTNPNDKNDFEFFLKLYKSAVPDFTTDYLMNKEKFPSASSAINLKKRLNKGIERKNKLTPEQIYFHKLIDELYDNTIENPERKYIDNKEKYYNEYMGIVEKARKVYEDCVINKKPYAYNEDDIKTP